MKKLFSVIVTGSLFAVVMVVAQAQMPGTAIRASIPFDFIVHGKTFPAGRYELIRVNDESIDLRIRNLDHKRDQSMFDTEAAYVGRTAKKNVLVFHRYGDSYFLSEVVTAGEDTGREVAPSHAERQLKREMARNQVEPETITVAALN